MENPVLFAMAVLAVLGTPGPTNTLLATAGATGGLRCSLPLIPAEAAGYTISILTLGLALGPVVAGAPLLAGALRVSVGALPGRRRASDRSEFRARGRTGRS